MESSQAIEPSREKTLKTDYHTDLTDFLVSRIE